MRRDTWLAILATAFAVGGLYGCSLILPFDGPIGEQGIKSDGDINVPVDASPRADAAIDAFVPMPDACTAMAWSPVLTAGNFDSPSTNAAWEDSGRFGSQSKPILPIISDVPSYEPHSQPNLAYFVWPTPVDQKLSQTITLPSSTSKLRFEGQRCFISETPGTASSKVDVNLRDPDGTLLTTLASYSNTLGTSPCFWKEIEWLESDVPLGAYAGADIVFSLEATSPNSRSVFLFDTLSVEAWTCAP